MKDVLFRNHAARFRMQICNEVGGLDLVAEILDLYSLYQNFDLSRRMCILDQKRECGCWVGCDCKVACDCYLEKGCDNCQFSLDIARKFLESMWK